jgi:hypothetical protein
MRTDRREPLPGRLGPCPASKLTFGCSELRPWRATSEGGIACVLGMTRGSEHDNRASAESRRAARERRLNAPSWVSAGDSIAQPIA